MFSSFKSTFRHIAARPSGLIGLSLTAAYILLSLLAPLLAPYDPTAQHADLIQQAPSWAHLMGTDSLGRDMFSRVLYGGRLALIVTACAAAIAVLWGGLVGILLGVVGGKADEISMRLVDAFLSIPWLLFLLLVASVTQGGAWTVVPILGFFYGVAVIRVSRAATLQVVSRDFITAAKARGERLSTLIRREVLPNVADILLVEGAMRWSWMLLAFSSLSFLGFGATPPTPDWGLMIANERGFMAITPWAVVYPCIALSGLIIGINLLADALGKGLGVDRAKAQVA
ncbi:peptide/nickel transport system permease protein [Pasteurella testudinis DSM 23072]|uniref:Peptide/nickel transport system permease protein n=1 Tax=Pasteurella testudinis DSM 23072 TaxID=1122938 RepID=A0A1W1UG03_9PAST|nr:ABC transporter permease [Pasteurella testudinis]SMB80025.1 peptide/nickel transport system permease protein [Pasteurella testudinis DSM 23072]SUB50616.1 dipeptide transport system permease DppC [Pasteurella testudinis]